jgi:hypothetical protein
VISVIADFGIKREKSDSIVDVGILNSAILNESVHTKTNFFESHSNLVFISTQVKIGEKFFSVIVYSTIFTQFTNV